MARGGDAARPDRLSSASPSLARLLLLLSLALLRPSGQRTLARIIILLFPPPFLPSHSRSSIFNYSAPASLARSLRLRPRSIRYRSLYVVLLHQLASGRPGGKDGMGTGGELALPPPVFERRPCLTNPLCRWSKITSRSCPCPLYRDRETSSSMAQVSIPRRRPPSLWLFQPQR